LVVFKILGDIPGADESETCSVLSSLSCPRSMRTPTWNTRLNDDEELVTEKNINTKWPSVLNNAGTAEPIEFSPAEPVA
jgi:hypothetical protein